MKAKEIAESFEAAIDQLVDGNMDMNTAVHQVLFPMFKQDFEELVANRNIDNGSSMSAREGILRELKSKWYAVYSRLRDSTITELTVYLDMSNYYIHRDLFKVQDELHGLYISLRNFDLYLLSVITDSIGADIYKHLWLEPIILMYKLLDRYEYRDYIDQTCLPSHIEKIIKDQVSAVPKPSADHKRKRVARKTNIYEYEEV